MMKNKLRLHLAIFAATLCAAFHRATPGALALGNTKTDPAEPPVDLAAENAALRKQLAARDGEAQQIAELVNLGLTHPQAVANLKHKADFRARAATVKAAKK